MEKTYLTTRGIYLDLHYSEYNYQYGDYILVFSSSLNLKRFTDRIDSYIVAEKLKFENTYKCKLNNDDIFVLKLYKIIEKRGFLIYYKDNELNYDYHIDIIIS